MNEYAEDFEQGKIKRKIYTDVDRVRDLKMRKHSIYHKSEKFDDDEEADI